MTKHIARLLDRLGAWCFDVSMKLNPLDMSAVSLPAVAHAITGPTEPIPTLTQTEQTAVNLVEAFNKPVFMVPGWALYDRQCLIVQNAPRVERRAENLRVLCDA